MKKNIQLKAAKGGLVTAIIATMNIVDKDGDVTLPGFFGEQEVIMLPTHDWTSIPLGKGVIKEEDGKAIAKIKMNLEISEAQKWHSALMFDLENGTPLQEWSYGFRILEGGMKRGEIDGRPVRFLIPKADGTPGCKVDEVSPVVVGAGEGTGTLTVKSNDGIKLCDEAEGVLASLTGLITRVKSLAELRAKDGRSLSAENQQRLKEVLIKLDDACPQIEALLVAPPDPEEDIRKEARRELRRFVVISNLEPIA